MLAAFYALAALTVAQDTVALDINAAVHRALTASPEVAAARGAIRAPMGERAEAFWPFPDNPQLEYGRARRVAGTVTTFDRELRLTQTLDISGGSFVRRSAASHRVDAATALARDAERRVALETRATYVALVLAVERVALTDSAAAFGTRLADFARARLDAGEINRLAYNAAVLEAARQRASAERAHADRAAIAADLSRLLGLPSDSVPRTVGLPSLPGPRLDPTAMLAVARAERPDLGAATSLLGAARRDVTAARLALVPTLTLGGSLGREANREDLLGFSIGFSIPLFHRQQATRGFAAAAAAIAEATRTAVSRTITAEVLATIERYRRAVVAEAGFARDLLQAATENVTLTERAFAEGELDITDVVVLRTAAVNAQLEYLAVKGDAYVAWFALAAALGVPPETIIDLAGETP